MRRFEVVLVSCGLVGLVACGSDAPRSALPYDPNSTSPSGVSRTRSVRPSGLS